MKAFPAALFIFCMLLLPPSAGASSCTDCHTQVEAMSTSHAGACTECHRGHEDKSDKDGAHEGLVTNPSDLTNPSFACGRCHESQAGWVRRTLMSTAAGIINQTRYLWGAQPDTAARYAAAPVDNLAMVPAEEESGALVDDLLRRRCLRCHLGTTGVSDASGGLKKGGAGCAACHVLNEKNGIDPDRKLVLPGDTSHSHRLTTAIPSSQCLQCHNGNRAGADYAGFFERDHSLAYNFEARDPDVLPKNNRHSYHFLLPDIHQERGMHCIDCHPVEELMGEGKIHSQSAGQVGVRCEDCHGTPGKPPRAVPVKSSDTRALRAAKANGRYRLEPGSRVLATTGGHLLTNTAEREGAYFLTSKVDGKVHKIPVLGREPAGKEPLNHRIPGHLDKMECAACHAAWTYQDLGLHLVRLDAADYDPWTWLTRQGDPQAADILEGNLDKPREQWSPPTAFDWLTGRSKIGMWLGGYSMRRWEGRILGVDSRGRISPMRPQYQYWVSRVDSNGKTLMDSVIPRSGSGKPALVWNPYVPHTIRPQTADCWDCHGSTRTLGLGQTILRAKDGKQVGIGRSREDGLGIDFDLDRLTDEQGNPLQVTSHDGVRFLSAEQLARMSARNPLYIKYLLEFFRGKEAYGDPAGFTGPKK